jgi:hypothetical protein
MVIAEFESATFGSICEINGLAHYAKSPSESFSNQISYLSREGKKVKPIAFLLGFAHDL